MNCGYDEGSPEELPALARLGISCLHIYISRDVDNIECLIRRYGMPGIIYKRQIFLDAEGEGALENCILYWIRGNKVCGFNPLYKY